VIACEASASAERRRVVDMIMLPIVV